jgi:hypothetical protein
MKFSRESTGIWIVAALYDQEGHDCDHAGLTAAMSTRITSERPLDYVRRMYMEYRTGHIDRVVETTAELKRREQESVMGLI